MLTIDPAAPGWHEEAALDNEVACDWLNGYHTRTCARADFILRAAGELMMRSDWTISAVHLSSAENEITDAASRALDPTDFVAYAQQHMLGSGGSSCSSRAARCRCKRTGRAGCSAGPGVRDGIHGPRYAAGWRS